MQQRGSLHIIGLQILNRYSQQAGACKNLTSRSSMSTVAAGPPQPLQQSPSSAENAVPTASISNDFKPLFLSQGSFSAGSGGYHKKKAATPSIRSPKKGPASTLSATSL